MYLILEGIDTAGKSTQLDILKQKYPTALFTYEPGATKLGVKLRKMALEGEANSAISEMFLFLADRAEHSFEVIKKNPNKFIISDRGFISGIAYAKDIPMKTAISLNQVALDGAYPNKVILLELSKEELTKRLSAKKNDHIESRGIDYLMEVQNRMKEVIKVLELDAKIIDASLSIEEIEKHIEEYISY
jgi:dTMP kinase